MPNETNRRKRISIIIPCFNEEPVFPHLQASITSMSDRMDDDVEILLIDDGSMDGTWKLIEAFASINPDVKGISLSRNFGHQAALSCGYAMATGDAVVCMDADLQDPPETVFKMIHEWQQGADIVIGVRTKRDGETRFKRWTASWFYRLIRLMSGRFIPADSGDFRLMNRKAVDALLQMPEYHRFIRGMVGWIGFRTVQIPYHRQARRVGETKFTITRMLRFAMDAIVSFSIVPLRLAYLLGVLLGLGIFIYLLYALIRHFVFGVALVPGWTSLLLAIVGFGAANLVCMGLMGEYIGRIYEQVKHRPLYLIRSMSKKPPAS